MQVTFQMETAVDKQKPNVTLNSHVKLLSLTLSDDWANKYFTVGGCEWKGEYIWNVVLFTVLLVEFLRGCRTDEIE